MLFNVNELLISLSLTLDFAEKDVLPNYTSHGIRAAYVAGRIARELGMPDEPLFDLVSYSLLHDNGVLGALRKSAGAGKPAETAMEANPEHCVEGEKNIRTFPFLSPQKGVILYHHEHFDGSGAFGLSGNEIPLYSRIIAMADAIAVLYAKGLNSDEILEALRRDARLFDPDVRKAVEKLGGRVEFWLGMGNMFVKSSLLSMLPKVSRELNYRQIRSISRIFSRIIDAKSPFTGSHSRGISERVGEICRYYEFDEKTYWMMRIAADLHDLGKLAVPNGILDKPAKLTRQEFMTIQSHPYYTRKILENIKGFEEITEWASNHHEKLDGSGYPYGLDRSRLDFNSRILACVDIYQALTEDRPYRKALSHAEAMKLMQGMARDGLIEPSVTEDMGTIFRNG